MADIPTRDELNDGHDYLDGVVSRLARTMRPTVHAADTRRAVGRRYLGARADGQPFGLVKQYPVMCGIDFVEQAETQGCEAPATTERGKVTCAACRAMISVGV